MRPPIQLPPPMVNFFRWVGSCIANIVHLEYNAAVAAKTALPPDVETALQTQPVHNWGELADVASAAAMSGIAQLVEAMIAYPFGTIAILWCVYETARQLRTLLGWFRQKRRTPSKKLRQTKRTSRKGSGQRPRPAAPEEVPPSKCTVGDRKEVEQATRVAGTAASKAPVAEPPECEGQVVEQAELEAQFEE